MLKCFQTILSIYPCLHLAIERKPGIFQRIINSQCVQAPLGIWSGPYPGFCLIAVNPEDVAIIVVNVDAVMHRVIFCVYQFHCYQSFHLNWRLKAHGLILDLKNLRNRYNNHKMYHFIKQNITRNIQNNTCCDINSCVATIVE